MRQNPARRTALLDAAIEVLAREGSRGLTLRAVDKEAAVPTGTASNYFAHRTDMLAQVMTRTRERLTPDPAELAGTMNAEPSREMVRTLMLQPGDRTGVVVLYLAMLGLIVDDLTVPELLTPHQLDTLIDTMVTRLLPTEAA